MNYRILTVLILLFALGASGCARATEATPTATPALPVASALPTLTRTPADTPTPPPTLTFTPGATLTPEATITPTLAPAFQTIKLVGLSWRSHYNMLLSIDFSGEIQPEDVVVRIEDDEIYACEKIEQFPKRLYCIGRGRNFYGKINVSVFPALGDMPVFESAITVPPYSK